MYLATVDARELRSSLLPPNAQTWVNRHVLFTHGNGVVMSPVTRKSTEGLPLFYLRNIPPVATGGPEIREPRIYYGEETGSYVIVKGSTPEFDYPKGKDNIYAAYDGTGGIRVGGVARRVHRRAYRRAYRSAYYWGAPSYYYVAPSYYYGARSYYGAPYSYGGPSYFGRRYWW